MKVKDAKLEDILHIFKLYEKYCGKGIVPINETDGYAKEALQYVKQGGGEFRYGSKWEGFDSKIQFSSNHKGDLSVSFYHNIHEEWQKKYIKEAEREGKKFEKAIESYLNTK